MTRQGDNYAQYKSFRRTGKQRVVSEDLEAVLCTEHCHVGQAALHVERSRDLGLCLHSFANPELDHSLSGHHTKGLPCGNLSGWDSDFLSEEDMTFFVGFVADETFCFPGSGGEAMNVYLFDDAYDEVIELDAEVLN